MVTQHQMIINSKKWDTSVGTQTAYCHHIKGHQNLLKTV